MRTGWAIAAVVGVYGSCGAAGTLAGPHFITKTYLASGSGGGTLQQGNNLVHTARVYCPRHETSCTLALSAMDEICASNHAFYIYVTVDDNAVDPGIFVSNPGPYSPCPGGNWADNYAVGPGEHTVKLYTVALVSGVQGPWSANYTVTIP